MYLGRVPITIITQYMLFERALCLNWQPNCDNKIKKQKLLHGKINSVCGNVLFVSDNAGDFDDKKSLPLKTFLRIRNIRLPLPNMSERMISALILPKTEKQKALFSIS